MDDDSNPNLRIIDSHIHLLQPDRFTYSWVKPGSSLDTPFLLSDYAELSANRCIAVEASVAPGQARAEFSWLYDVASTHDQLAGIIAFADVSQGVSVEHELQWLIQHGNQYLKGVRYVLGKAYRDDPELCLRQPFIEGVQMLAAHDLLFEIAVDFAQLKYVARLVAACPTVQFVLEHMGKPEITGNDPRAWCQYMQQFAALPNVVCKVSNIIRAGNGELDPKLYAPYIQVLAETFGFDRLMFGSDAPVMLNYGTFDAQIAVLRSVLKPYSAKEQRAFFGDTAARVYHLQGAT